MVFTVKEADMIRRHLIDEVRLRGVIKNLTKSCKPIVKTARQFVNGAEKSSELFHFSREAGSRLKEQLEMLFQYYADTIIMITKERALWEDPFVAAYGSITVDPAGNRQPLANCQPIVISNSEKNNLLLLLEEVSRLKSREQHAKTTVSLFDLVHRTFARIYEMKYKLQTC